ncbi:MAG: hypothetical protein KDJ16_12900 [Hyphomicrobiales bacterium]|nr:hypothetical protein [Hyphomicrobiales bacterium]
MSAKALMATAFLATAFAGSAATVAWSADVNAEDRVMTKIGLRCLPECDSGYVTRKIIERSAQAYPQKDRHTVWIKSIDGESQSRLSTSGPSMIDKRYCRATATMFDGSAVPVYYLIEKGTGFAGLGWNVDYCIPGRDYYRVYDAWCRVVRPQ